MISAQLKALVARQEGFRADVYRDKLGYWTIGCGHLISKNQELTADQARLLCGAPWTREQALAKLSQHLEETEAQVLRAFPWAASLPPLVYDGLLDMAYQLGLGGVQGFPKMLASLRAGDCAAAERHALASVWAREQTPTRAAEVAGMIGNKVYPSVE